MELVLENTLSDYADPWGTCDAVQNVADWAMRACKPNPKGWKAESACMNIVESRLLYNKWNIPDVRWTIEYEPALVLAARGKERIHHAVELRATGAKPGMTVVEFFDNTW